MKSCPVYTTIWSEMLWEEKEQMRIESEDRIGYDP